MATNLEMRMRRVAYDQAEELYPDTIVHIRELKAIGLSLKSLESFINLLAPQALTAHTVVLAARYIYEAEDTPKWLA